MDVNCHGQTLDNQLVASPMLRIISAAFIVTLEYMRHSIRVWTQPN
jgi:hypothetical protein